MDTHIHFRDYKCTPSFEEYATTGNTAIRLLDATDGSPVATATVNLSNIALEPTTVLIKNWSENAGVYEALLEAEIIEPLKAYVPCGYVKALVCDLSEKGKKMLSESPSFYPLQL